MASTVLRGKPVRYGLLRHGKTIWNEQKRIQGSTDSPLTAEGIRGVEHWGKQLKTSPAHPWHRIIHSPQQRARDTARILATILAIAAEPLAGLREQAWGSWEGLTLKDITRDCGAELAAQIASGWEFRPPHGESRKEVLQRSRASLIEYSARYPEHNILVITHQGVIKALLYDLLAHDYLCTPSPAIRKNCFHRIQCHQGALSINKVDIPLHISP